MTHDPRHRVGLRARTHVIDAILAGCSARLDPDAIDAVTDCALSATVAACRDGHVLVDFDEYLARGAL